MIPVTGAMYLLETLGISGVMPPHPLATCIARGLFLVRRSRQRIDLLDWSVLLPNGPPRLAPHGPP